MRQLLPIVLCWAFLLSLPAFISAQSIRLTGTVLSERSGTPLADVLVSAVTESTVTDEKGQFDFNVQVPEGPFSLSLVHSSYQTTSVEIDPQGRSNIDLGVVKVKALEGTDQLDSEDIIPVITISTDDQQSAGAENISGLLTASRDVFINTAAFTFGPARFRIRGYDSEETQVLLNGLPINDIESGRVYWSTWGGLNDVFRNRANLVGLGVTDVGFAGIGGATLIDLRASRQRKQLRVSYALSNRTYDHRLMATWSTGVLPGGWAFSFSGSRRWAQEGYAPGTFYDAWAYFASVDKLFGDKHILNLTAFGAPIKRGRNTASVQEMYDYAGTNYYNAYWGYQNGEKRNSRVFNNHQPVIMLSHDWEVSEQIKVKTGMSYQFGRNGSTALDWYNAPDPRPDYYRKLPSFIEGPQAEAVEELLRTSEAARQINWDQMYQANRISLETITDVNGIPGNDVTGLRAQYIVEDRRYDAKRFNFNTRINFNPNPQSRYVGGLGLQQFTGHNFKEVVDLLGADFYVDIDKFAEFDSTANRDFIQNDLDNPNRLVREGDQWGYDYQVHIYKTTAWLQAQWLLRHVDLHLGGTVGNTTFWRNGLVRNGKFPDNSAGESERQGFLEYQAKAGLTYKINGRNYLLLNGAYQERAPFARNAFISPRTRNEVIPDLETTKILSLEGGYQLKAPKAKIRAMGYYTTFSDQIFNRSFYLDNAIQTSDGVRGGFVNYIMTGMDTRHMGLELAAEVEVFSGFKLLGVAAIGEYIYTSRPTVSIFLDNVAQNIGSETAYIKNFYVAGRPQQAYSFGINYTGKKYWFANLNFNYFDQVWIEFNPARRTVAAVATVDDPEYQEQSVEPGSELWNEIIRQEKAPSAFTLDFFGGKSFKFGDVYLYLTVGVSNILDNQDFITGGYEQFRFDFETKDVNRFPPRYFYQFGRTYFINVAFRI